jgi:hypothetical protein
MLAKADVVINSHRDQVFKYGNRASSMHQLVLDLVGEVIVEVISLVRRGVVGERS